MQNNMSATDVLVYLITLLQLNLTELVSAEDKNDFVLGSWEAAVECLEVIGHWDLAKEYGLDYNPEDKFKLK